MYDKSQKDVGVLLKLNHLKKRLEIIKFLTGTWKPTTKKYNTMTEQVRYVQKKLELLNEAKIAHFKKRAEQIKEEVEDLHNKSNEDNKDKLQKRED
jgi:ABC-type transporter Mla subunit MlaD